MDGNGCWAKARDLPAHQRRCTQRSFTVRRHRGAVEMGEIPLGVRLLHEELQPFAGRGRLAEGLRRTPNQVSDVAANVLNVWPCASSLGSRAPGGRTLLQKGEMKHNLPTTFVMDVCPSHSRFRPISADIKRSRKPSKEARFRALKAVARVRIPSGLPGKAPIQRLFRVSSQFDHLSSGTCWVPTSER